jgi:hypothetical protein
MSSFGRTPTSLITAAINPQSKPQTAVKQSGYTFKAVIRRTAENMHSGLEPDIRRDLHERQPWAGSGWADER